jgi:3-keto-5-aminohexanoate cleavage enzyme
MIKIRKMLPRDYDAVIEILAGWNMAPVAPSKEIPDPERSNINIQNTFVALDGDAVVGVASYIELTPELAETASLAVNSRYKGSGIGFKLQEARLVEMIQKGIKCVRSETDRPETINWYIKNFGYHIAGKNPKKHSFSLSDVDSWTVLELDLENYKKKIQERF